MSESTETAGTVVPAESESPSPTETVEFWKQKAREQEKRAKENAAAAKRLAEIEEAQKSEAEKAADLLATAQREADQARMEATRYRIATEFSLSAEDADALEHIASEEGMRLVAERLAGKSDQRTKNGNHVPREGTAPRRPAEDEMREFTRNLFDVGGK